MPLRDSDGKPLSGAALQRRRKAKLEHERKRKKAQPSGALSYADLPAPPIGKKDGTAQLITWGAKALAVTMHRAMVTPDAFEAERDQWRFVADCCAKLGMIRDKAAEQEQIKKGLRGVKKDKDTAGLTDASGRATPRVPRPPE